MAEITDVCVCVCVRGIIHMSCHVDCRLSTVGCRLPPLHSPRDPIFFFFFAPAFYQMGFEC